LYSSDFKKILRNSTNPYGDGGASKKIKDTIKDINLDGILKKSFYDIKKIF
jgi:GDP/UDP-N,N'-diacetylbacillosamine 2-epimerase (hydrolysing)